MRHLFFLILALILIVPRLPSTAQSDSLTAQETMRIGRGTIRHVEWHPDDDLILVDTANGAWLYDDNLNDVAHLPDIRLTRFSPDGQYISGVNAADELLIYDAHSRDLLHTFAQHDHHIRELHWQGNHLATYDGYQLLLWEDLQVMATIDWRFLEMITWNPSGTILVAKQLNGNLLVVTAEGEWWEFDAPGKDTQNLQWANGNIIFHTYITEDRVQIAHQLDARTGEILEQAYSARYRSYSLRDGWLAATTSDGPFIVSPSGEVIVHLETLRRQTHRISWSPDGKFVAYSETEYFNRYPALPMVHVIDRQGNIVWSLHNHETRFIQHLLWHPAGSQLLTVDEEQRIFVWAFEILTEKSSLDDHVLVSDHYTISPSGDLLAIADTMTGFTVWDENGMRYRKTVHTSPIELIEWQTHGDWLATSTEIYDTEPEPSDPRVIVWDGSSGHTIEVINAGSVPQDLEWRPDGKVLAITTFPDTIFWDGTTTIYTSEQLNFEYLYGPKREIDWSSDGQYVTITHKPGTADVASLRSYRNLPVELSWTVVNSAHDPITAIPTWENGEWKQLSYYRLPGYEAIYYPIGLSVKTLYPVEEEITPLDYPGEPVEETTYYPDVAWSPDASLVIAQSDSNILRIWDVESGAYIYWTEGYAFAFSPNSQYLAILTDAHVNILDARTGEILLGIDEARFPQDEYELQWSDDGTHLAIGGEGMVSVWEIKPE